MNSTFVRNVVGVVVATLVLAVALGLFLFQDYQTRLDLQKKALLADHYESVKVSVESLFQAAYHTNRTISLLPGVRAMTGKNRANADQDIVALKRFTVESDLCAQQLYNNLATSASVSEVYGVLNGLNASAGEVPFFMYDTLIIDKTKAKADAAGTNQAVSADVPDQSEVAEYTYFPTALQYFQQNFPTFNFSNLDKIPALSSPVMRTCDNAQYLSVSKGNVHDADGICYMTPFYSSNGAELGMIVTVIRTNVLEALMLNVPFLVLTEDDKTSAQTAGFNMPADMGNFVLVNSKTGVTVGDRRDPKLIDTVSAMVRDQSKDSMIHSAKLDIPDASDWQLFYRFDPTIMKQFESATVWQAVGLFTALIVVAGLVLFVIFMLDRKRRQVLSVVSVIQEITENDDLTRQISLNRKDEVGEVAKVFNTLISKLRSIIEEVRSNAASLTTASEVLAHGATSLAEGSHQESEQVASIAASTGNSSSAMNSIAAGTEEMSVSVKGVADAIAQMNASLTEVSRSCAHESVITGKATTDAKAVKDLITELEKASHEIEGIISVINAIADQTNLLALNATIEAARAGQQGKGFAVVANEVKELAHQTAQATERVRQQIEGMGVRTAHAVTAMSGISAIINEIDQISHTIAGAVEEQTATMHEISGSIDGASQATEEVARRVAESASSLTGISDSVQAVRGVAQKNATEISTVSGSAQSLAALASNLEKLVAQFTI